MKRILSILLVICMAFGVCCLTACNTNSNSGKVDPNKNIYEDLEEFDSYVPDESEIIGTWVMTSPSTDIEWTFFANTTLHQTRTDGGVQRSTVCTFNYDGKDCLKVYGLSATFESEYTVVIEENVLTLTDKDGSVLKFDKQK